MNPLDWTNQRLRTRGTRRWEPASGVEDNQGAPSMRPGELAALQVPRDPGLNTLGFNNPYRMAMYGPIQLSTNVQTSILSANKNRVYLILQNQGPGNVWVGFGQDVTAPTVLANSNGLQLVATQVLEQIGGGFVVLATGQVIPQAFVTADYIQAITDTAGTTMLAMEGIALFAV